ncbi:mechanosensitive ion channel [Qipengyuania atrilutea]|uniref:Small-conductance mechanosensitive channel n=1 Tax=Qipengyuania atrilutea TaxID=2744473 RepID=A0A850H375_9SPHN|nr:mechanosensitive ion channel [Actirhodobacter atriluteus]NVD45116.1 mechanosensitive ion channel [Actirhodobacter atriluteus]
MGFGNYRFDQQLAVSILEKVVLAIVILVVTWALAKAAKWAFAKLVDNVSFFQRNAANGTSLGESLGKIVSLLIWLIGLLAVLQVFDLGGAMSPVQTLLNDIAGFIPNLIGAGLIFFIGMMIAKIVRDLTVTALQTVDFDKWINRGGGETLTGNSRLSSTIGTIVYAVIVIFVSILALDALELETISEPASNMLAMILNAIPRIIGAALLLGIGYLVSRFVVQLLKEILPGLGVDRAIGSTDLLPGSTTISSIVARVAQIAIILFFAVAATRLLGFPELTAILNEVLELGGQVIFGAVVILVGFLIARMIASMIGGSEESGLAASIIKWATILLFTFMGLQFMGVGEEIVLTAFSALVIGGAVAGALAFGLGGREWAGRKLEELDEHARSRKLGSSASPKPAERENDKPLPPGA